MMPKTRYRWLRIRALMIKEFLQVVRDPSSILITVVLPLILLFLYGDGASLDLDHLRIGLVLEDTAPDAMSFAHSLTDSKYFEVKIVRDRRELLDDITRGAIRGYVVVPSCFSEFRTRPDTIAPIQVITDGSEPNTANFVQNYVLGAFQVWLKQEGISDDLKGLPQINIQSRFWYNEQLESRYFLLSGSLAIIMTLIGTLLTALVVSREWERGTMEALMSTTIGIKEIVLGKIIPYFILGLVSMGICMIVSSAFLYCALGLGLMISTIAKSQIVASQIAVMSGFLPAYILSGFLFEIASMPHWIRALTYFIPAKYFVQCLQALFLVGNVWELIFYNMVPMLLIGTLFFFITSRKMVKRLD